MIEPGLAIHQAKDLLDCIHDELKDRDVKLKVPEYLPPVMLDGEAAKWMVLAIRELAKVTSPRGSCFLCTFYRDRRDAAGCCLVISVEIRQQLEGEQFAVEHTWASEFARISEELMSHSVAMNLFQTSDGFQVDFEFPVYGRVARRDRYGSSVLLVEDDPFVRRSTREVLELEGYWVLEAVDAESGYERFREHSYEIELVISDVTLPGEDGRQLASRIRMLNPQIPILLTSGYVKSKPGDRARQIYCLTKPYHPTSLLSSVRECLASRYSVTAAPIPRRGEQSFTGQM